MREEGGSGRRSVGEGETKRLGGKCSECSQHCSGGGDAVASDFKCAGVSVTFGGWGGVGVEVIGGVSGGSRGGSRWG